MDAQFCELNASVTGTKELKEVLENAKFRFYGLENKTTYVYVDEFHRWNKLQQDSLLKALEEGIIRFIGSTTENPYFSINNAVLSRVRALYEFHRLNSGILREILDCALEDGERGLKKYQIACEPEALDMITELSNGDARVALDTLGFIAENIPMGEKITVALVGEAMQSKVSFYDGREDKYNLLSALQKSIRGSDPARGDSLSGPPCGRRRRSADHRKKASGHRFRRCRDGFSSGRSALSQPVSRPL